MKVHADVLRHNHRIKIQRMTRTRTTKVAVHQHWGKLDDVKVLVQVPNWHAINGELNGAALKQALDIMFPFSYSVEVP